MPIWIYVVNKYSCIFHAYVRKVTVSLLSIRSCEEWNGFCFLGYWLNFGFSLCIGYFVCLEHTNLAFAITIVILDWICKYDKHLRRKMQSQRERERKKKQINFLSSFLILYHLPFPSFCISCLDLNLQPQYLHFDFASCLFTLSSFVFYCQM